MSIIKNMSALLTVAAFAIGAAVPVMAEDNANAPLTLEYKDIEQQVLTNNLQVKNNEATIENMKFNRFTETTQDTTSEINNMIQTALYSMDSIINNTEASPDVIAVAGSTKLTLSMIGSMYGSMAGSQNTQYSSYSQQLNLTKLQFEQTDQQLVNATQSMFATYYQLLYNINQLESSKASLEDSLSAAKVQLSLGMTTKLDVSETEKSISELENNLADLENQASAMKGEINKMLGRSADAELTLGKMPSPDLNYVNKINVEEDAKTAVKNSYTIQYKEKELEYLKAHGSGDYRVDNNDRKMKKNEIESETESVKTSLQQQYNTIVKQQNALNVEQQKLSTEQTKLAQTQKKYDLGRASGLELKSQKNAVAAQQAVVDSANATLFWNIESYKAIVSGLPASN